MTTIVSIYLSLEKSGVGKRRRLPVKRKLLLYVVLLRCCMPTVRSALDSLHCICPLQQWRIQSLIRWLVETWDSLSAFRSHKQCGIRFFFALSRALLDSPMQQMFQSTDACSKWVFEKLIYLFFLPEPVVPVSEIVYNNVIWRASRFSHLLKTGLQWLKLWLARTLFYAICVS